MIIKIIPLNQSKLHETFRWFQSPILSSLLIFFTIFFRFFPFHSKQANFSSGLTMRILLLGKKVLPLLSKLNLNSLKKINNILLFFLFINHTQAQDITVDLTVKFKISSGVIFHVNGLTLTPSATFELDGLSITKNPAITQTVPMITAIQRAYTFNSTSPPFSGTVKVDYVDGELNGLSENTLEVNYYQNTSWYNVSTASNDATDNYVISNALINQSFKEITLASSAAPLPITWLNFTATPEGKNILLNWSTALEINTLDFLVQHSTDGTVYTNIATQAAAGNSTSILNYHYVHTSPVLGYNYYRLQQRDFDGESSYSPIRSVKLNTGLNTNEILVICNPIQNNELKLVTPVDQEIALYDMVGKLLLQQQLKAGTHTLDVSFLPYGTYILRTVSSSQKIIKL
jgi:hypothetical protein